MKLLLSERILIKKVSLTQTHKGPNCSLLAKLILKELGLAFVTYF